MKSMNINLDDAIERRKTLYDGQRPDEDDYGYNVMNPIMMGTVPRCTEYLERLRTENGEVLTYEHRGWIDFELYGIDNVVVDEYQLFLNGEPYKTIYMCGYGMNSEYAPKGLKLVDKAEAVSTTRQGTSTPVVKSKEPAAKPRKTAEISTHTNSNATDENIKALKDLLETGVISQEEYEAKVEQISSAKKTAIELQKKEIDYDELKKADDLYKDGVISEDEFTQKAAQIIGLNNDAVSKLGVEEKGGIISWAKKNIAAVVVIALLAAALAVIGPQYGTMQSEIDNLNKTIDEKSSTISSLTSQKLKLQKYKDVVLDFYLDNAVLVRVGDSTYYHRYQCSTFPYEYRYMLYNIDNAKGQGYKQCPECFGTSGETYCESHF